MSLMSLAVVCDFTQRVRIAKSGRKEMQVIGPLGDERFSVICLTVMTSEATWEE
jgi:hypothetical protein